MVCTSVSRRRPPRIELCDLIVGDQQFVGSVPRVEGGSAPGTQPLFPRRRLDGVHAGAAKRAVPRTAPDAGAKNGPRCTLAGSVGAFALYDGHEGIEMKAFTIAAVAATALARFSLVATTSGVTQAAPCAGGLKATLQRPPGASSLAAQPRISTDLALPEPAPTTAVALQTPQVVPPSPARPSTTQMTNTYGGATPTLLALGAALRGIYVGAQV